MQGKVVIIPSLQAQSRLCPPVKAACSLITGNSAFKHSPNNVFSQTGNLIHTQNSLVGVPIHLEM